MLNKKNALRGFPPSTVIGLDNFEECAYSTSVIISCSDRCGCITGFTSSWRTASNKTIATAVARFRLRVPCIGIVMQLSMFAASNFSAKPLVSRPKTRKSPGLNLIS